MSDLFDEAGEAEAAVPAVAAEEAAPARRRPGRRRTAGRPSGLPTDGRTRRRAGG